MPADAPARRACPPGPPAPRPASSHGHECRPAADSPAATVADAHASVGPWPRHARTGDALPGTSSPQSPPPWPSDYHGKCRHGRPATTGQASRDRPSPPVAGCRRWPWTG
ncbi:hypothetical protein WR25_21725 [Diploscapter pachys]|uniref:Uncharacterized protein n=1 Tax=Diploscapter pachys TaxID=2018661 RepID=A0A2A2M5A4_9BILA|nr:hypothetical protein WR25_21725 [Diploscapter pachys]